MIAIMTSLRRQCTENVAWRMTTPGQNKKKTKQKQIYLIRKIKPSSDAVRFNKSKNLLKMKIMIEKRIGL